MSEPVEVVLSTVAGGDGERERVRIVPVTSTVRLTLLCGRFAGDRFDEQVQTPVADYP